MRVQVFRHLIHDLARALGKDTLPISEAHVCSICVNESCCVHISYSEAQDAVHWTSFVCGTAGRDTQALYRHLLRCNLDGAAMAGGFFGLGAVNQPVVYRYHEPLECLHSQRFAAIFETFSAAAVRWSGQLAHGFERQTQVSATLAAPSDMRSGDVDVLFNRV